MPGLTPRRHMNVIRLYIQGDSYQAIAQKSGVAKGSVVNVITMLKSGQFPAFRDNDDQVDALREVAVQLKRSGLSLPAHQHSSQLNLGSGSRSRRHLCCLAPTQRLCEHRLSTTTS